MYWKWQKKKKQQEFKSSNCCFTQKYIRMDKKTLYVDELKLFEK